MEVDKFLASTLCHCGFRRTNQNGEATPSNPGDPNRLRKCITQSLYIYLMNRNECCWEDQDSCHDGPLEMVDPNIKWYFGWNMRYLA